MSKEEKTFKAELTKLADKQKTDDSLSAFEDIEEDDEEEDDDEESVFDDINEEKKENEVEGKEGKKKEEVVEEVKKEEEVEEVKEEKAVDEKVAAKVKEDLLKIVGEDAVAKIKGKEIPVKDLTPEETMFYLQRGIRADDVFKKASEMKRDAEKTKEGASQSASLFNQMMSKRKDQPFGEPSGKEATYPKGIQDDETDSEDVKAQKEVSRKMFDELQDLKGQAGEARILRGEQELFGTIEKHQPDYPLASTEEVICVKAQYRDVPIDKIMQESDKRYGSTDFVEKVFKHRPDIKRHFYDKFVSAYVAKKPTQNKIAEKPSGGTRVKTGEEKKVPRTFEEATEAAKKALAERRKAVEDEELS